MSGGGKAVEEARKNFQGLILKLVKLASLQTSFLTLDEALKVVSRRKEALQELAQCRLAEPQPDSLQAASALVPHLRQQARLPRWVAIRASPPRVVTMLARGR